MNPIGFEQHDHTSCVDDGVEAVEAYCKAEGLQFTDVRRRVLEMLLTKHRAFGAYEILDRLREENLGSQPPIAYRALDFLVKHGFAHKIERLNAFIACNHPGRSHSPAFLICRVCDAVAEAQSQPSRSMIGSTARKAGFTIERTVIEAVGVCPNCTGDADS